jgi:hypothetical protein
MAAVDSIAGELGLAEKLLTGAIPDDVPLARRAIARVAVASMLAEPTDFAAYGWTHCLTMPYAVLGIAPHLRDSARAIAVAATHVVGFRASMSTRPAAWSAPSDRHATATDVARAIERGDPEDAAVLTASVGDEHLAATRVQLATNAACAHDAHLVKYTLTCMRASAVEPADERRFLAAAAKLAAWWHAHPDPTDPLG